MSTWSARVGARLDALLARFSYGIVPAAIVLVTLLALFFPPGERERARLAHGVELAFAVVPEPAQAGWDPADAAAALQGEAARPHMDTGLSEQPFWIRVAPLGDNLEDRVLEFPSRHATDLACWDAATLAPLGRADRTAASGMMGASRAGFMLRLHPGLAHEGVLCRARHTGPARITVESWPHSALLHLNGSFHRGSGLLEGGLLMLALFTLFTAMVNRDARYVLLAVWLIGNLRLGAISMGWDTQWLGRPIPADWMPRTRMLTIGAYYLVTYTLFTQVFRDDIRRFGQRMVGVGQTLGLVLLALAVVAPFAVFLPIMWVIVTVGLSIIIVFLARTVIVTRSRTAIGYSAALALVLMATFSEVVAAAFGLRMMIGSVNSVTAALVASVLAAFAFADQMRSERRDRLRAQAELERTYDVTPVGLFTLDETGRFVRANQAMRHMIAMPLGEGGRWSDSFGEESWHRVQALSRDYSPREIEVQLLPRGGGEPCWFLVRVAGLDGLIEGSLQDITQSRRLTEKLRYLANNDSLTGALNRRGIEKRLADAIAAVPAGGGLALAYLDLDRFKLVNDLYGHQTGDEVLRQVAERLGAVLEGRHAIGRIGGDEFIVVLTGVTLDEASALCRAFIARIVGEPYRVRNQAFQVGVSTGLIGIDAQIETKDAISAADRACREAKSGRNGGLVVYAHDASALRERSEELHLIEALGGDFSPEGLFLQMQPILSLHAPREHLDFEVLVRMRGEDGRVIPAGRVIAAAEASGNISALDQWILATTLQWLREHRARLDRTRFVCVNVSGASLNDETFLEEVFGVLGRYQDVAHLLCFEITEGIALQDIDNSRRFIDRLRQYGSRVALDDFGAGYTSFRYLKELAAEALKIDGSFVLALNHHPSNFAILEAIVQLARNLGMRSVAEWVEDADTLQTLAELGVDYVQGYLVAKPMMPDELLAGRSAADFSRDPAFLAVIDRIEQLHAAGPGPMTGYH